MRGLRGRGSWLLLALVLLGAAAIRGRLLSVPLERDEGEFAYAGQLLLQGVLPFQLVYTMKLPGTSAMYAGAMALFGQTIAGARLGLVVVNAGTTLLLFLLGRRLLGPPAGLATATAFACLSLSTQMLGIFGHATHFVLLPAVAGLLALCVAVESGRRATLFLSGVLFGLAVLMKQPGAVFLLFALAWLIWAPRRPDGAGAPRWLRAGALVVVGAALPVAATVLLVAWGGALETFWFWVVRYSGHYARGLPPGPGLEHLVQVVSRFVPQAALFWGLAGLGLALLASPGAGLPHRSFLIGLTAFSVLGACPGFYFREHYFILTLPAVSLLVGAAARGLLDLASRAGLRRLAQPGLLLVLVMASGHAIATQRDILFGMSPEQVSRSLYGLSPWPESVDIGRYLRDRTRPDDRIAVFGSEPQIYFYARRRSATGHIYMYSLMEPHPFARRLQEEMIREIEASRPAYVVWIKAPMSWLESPGSERRLFDWAAPYLSARYELAGQVVLAGPDRTRTLWEEAAAAMPLGEATWIVVLRRKDFVVPRATPSGPPRPASRSVPASSAARRS